MLTMWHLRGRVKEWSRLQRQIRPGQFDLIIVDPIYKLLLLSNPRWGVREENSPGHISLLLDEIENLATRTGAAIIYGGHFAKGDPSLKDSIDRQSGSGVWARDPDAVLTMTRHEERDCFTVELTLRLHAPVEPFVVKWEYPRFVVVTTLDPTKLKRVGRPAKYDPKELLDLIDEPMLASEIVKLAKDELGIEERRVFDLLRELKRSQLLRQPQKRGKYERV
jgi:hypothetical protein